MPSSAGGELTRFVAAPSWVRAATQCGFNIAPLLEEANIDLCEGPAPLVRVDDLVLLMRRCVEHSLPEHYFPLVGGQAFTFERHPALATFLATSPTARSALPALEWASLLIATMSMHIEESGRHAALIIDVKLSPQDARTRGYFTEMTLSAFQKFAHLLLGHQPLAKQISLRHDPGPQLACCEAMFGSRPIINQPRDRIVFPRSWLDMPLLGAFPMLHQQARQEIEQQLPATAAEGLAASIERALFADPRLLGQGIERLAARMELHPRTLQRRLRNNGQQLTDIIMQVRRRMSIEALTGDTPDIESISDKLGFADRHSFSRAFRRWTGLAPSEYRRRHRGNQSPSD